ncbi:MAG: bacterial regulatory s, gntR family protein, partial [Caulobacteraceae bacterium]|nr:bacterial regulatory s, gntR family protein [Caulobacteraceae bacterium]
YVTAATDKMMATAAGALIELEDVQLLDVLEILEALYVKAAALACVHASEEELSTILQTLDALEREDGADKLGVSLRKFLGLVADASHNVLVATLCKFLNDLLMRVAQNEIGGVTANWPRIAGRLGEDRRDLMNALLARDVEGAMAAAAAYHRHTRSLVKDAMDAYQGPPGDGLRDAFKRLRQTES